jgi:hypothetical protein
MKYQGAMPARIGVVSVLLLPAKPWHALHEKAFW